MAVYVDDMQLPARAGGRDSAWSHLFAGTYEQLQAFAARLGLRRAWFRQGNRPRLGHYDVTAGKRQQAIQLRASPVTFREAGQVIRAQAGSRSQGKEGEHAPAPGRKRAGLPKPRGRDGAPTARREHKDGAGPKRHSWDKRDDYHKTCRDCGIQVLARPHPYQRRWYSEYTTTDGRCFVADRVPPCEPAAQPRPAPEDERARHASELDRAAGRAWQRGDLQRAAGLIADARALDPARAHLWAKREAAIAAAAPRSAPSTQAESAGYGRTCNEPHPHQDSYLAARRSVEVGDTGRCHDGHPVSYLRHDVAARLIAAGFTASSPELARIREWNRAALDRAGIRPVGRGQGGGDDMNGQKKLTPSDTVAVLFAARHAQAPGILRSLQDIWVCASAARYGEPYETWQLGDLDAYRTHDLAACEAENDQPARPWDQEGPL